MKVVVATHNQHKVDEISTALDFPGWEFVPLSSLGDFPEPVEDGGTFLANARIKALAAFENTGLPSIADDSGLVVDALGGRPGVYSSRYAGEHATDDENNRKLLMELQNVPEGKRTARFVSTLVFIDAEGNETVATGTCEGSIGLVEHGTGGFGYDPLFLPDVYCGELALAEVGMDEKNSISHRGNALRNLRKMLEDGQSL